MYIFIINNIKREIRIIKICNSDVNREIATFILSSQFANICAREVMRVLMEKERRDIATREGHHRRRARRQVSAGGAGEHFRICLISVRGA